jgi:ancient ubiquitous protein 1
MTYVRLNELFDTNRYPPFGLQLVTVILYFPVGLMLAVLRIFIGFHAYIVAWLLPKASFVRRIVLRVMCGVVGLLVIQDDPNPDNRRMKCRVLVANYTSPIDRLAVEMLFPIVMPSMWDLPSSLMWLLGYEDMGAKHGRETLIQNAKKHCHESLYPLLAFPEGATTNGKAGLLKFSVWPFSLDEPVQPIVIKIVRPWITPLTPSVAGSSWWSDLFWFLFVPYSCFHIRLLPVITQFEDETVQEFARRAQELMAASLLLTPTKFTSADKIDFLKQQQQRQDSYHEVNNRSGVGMSSAMDMMVSQVQNVLPHVPAHIICQDLNLTKDVDLTINNILEGRVASFLTEQPPVEAVRTGSPPPTETSLTGVSKPTASFPRTSAERHLTFAERKKAMLNSARQRYLEKHGGLTGISLSQHTS